jgi:AbrB family looped-hinge helix DNA binding protein
MNAHSVRWRRDGAPPRRRSPTATDAGQLAKAPRLSDYSDVFRKPLIDVVQIGKHGEIQLPRRLRNSLSLHEGDQLVVTVEDRRLVLERRARHLGAYLDVLGAGSGARED